jgi:hypothetical protein
LERTLIPLRKFLLQFEQYKSVLSTDVEGYIKAFSEDESNDVDEFRAEIKMNTLAKELIVDSLPNKVSAV